MNFKVLSMIIISVFMYGQAQLSASSSRESRRYIELAKALDRNNYNDAFNALSCSRLLPDSPETQIHEEVLAFKKAQLALLFVAAWSAKKKIIKKNQEKLQVLMDYVKDKKEIVTSFKQSNPKSSSCTIQ
ncbi:MAG TPA: hypothetical protein VLG50_04580 [Candidatus Saccharimonadales bacterium]|nr:hypothetical protein [Candidatus Saccharimonadales bacterium]